MQSIATRFWILPMVLLVLKQAESAAEQVKVTTSSNEEVSCSVFKGYDITPGFDIQLIHGSSDPDCCRRCFETEGCLSWTMYQGKCHLKGNNELVKARVPEDTVSGIRNAAGNEAIAVFSDKAPEVQSPSYAAGKQSTCSVHTGFAIEGDVLKDIGYAYLSECCHACGNTPDCASWTHTGSTCLLKKGNILVKGEESDISGLVLGGNDAPPSPQ